MCDHCNDQSWGTLLYLRYFHAPQTFRTPQSSLHFAVLLAFIWTGCVVCYSTITECQQNPERTIVTSKISGSI